MKNVIVYGTPTCVFCRMAKEYFGEHGIKYEDVNVYEDEKAREEIFNETGQTGVPVVKIGDEYVPGFDKKRFAELLNIQE